MKQTRIAATTSAPLLRRRGRPDPAESEEVLSKLYNIAYRHFMVNGVADANLLSIAREAGVSRQMIHNRFGNKQQFFEAVCHLARESVAHRFSVSAMPATTNPWVVFNFLGNEFCNVEMAPQALDLFRVMNIATSRHPEIATAHAADIDKAHAFIMKHLRAAGRALSVEILDAKGAARDFLALVEGIVQPVLQNREQRPSPQQQAKQIDAMVRRYLRGLGFDETKSK